MSKSWLHISPPEELSLLQKTEGEQVQVLESAFGKAGNPKADLAIITGVGSSNNYAYLVNDDESKDAVIIDPANPPECVSPHYPTSYPSS